MAVIEFLRSPLGRAARMATGFALIVYGSTLGSLAGLVLMMVGMVPAVTGLADICLGHEIAGSFNARQRRTQRPQEGSRLAFRTRNAHRGGSHV
jgi:DUF2892 family protein